jgi:predicted negative regulator of RcsB-dependent stress response
MTESSTVHLTTAFIIIAFLIGFVVLGWTLWQVDQTTKE